MQAAIVTTVKSAQDVLESWIFYHLHIGFRLVILFFDDTEEANFWNDYFDERVVIIKCDEKLKERLKGLISYPHLEQYYNDEVQARQHLNAELGIDICIEKGIDWLLHIDIDELFYSEENLIDHLTMLNNNNIGTLTYENYEAIPENEFIGNCFEEITLFKRNLSSVKLSPTVANCLSFWKNKTTYGQYFIAYDIGKSITRVNKGVVPESVHKWKLNSGNKLRTASTIIDVRSLDLTKIFHLEKQACVLHYVSCGFQQWENKYKILSSFPDSWFGGSLKIHPSFHLESRDIVGKGNKQEMFDFYSRQVVFKDKNESQSQLNSGLCVRIEKVKEILSSNTRQLKLKPKSQNEQRDEFFNETIISSENNNNSPDNNNNNSLNNNNNSLNNNNNPKVSDSNLSLDQMWIISSLVSQYVKTDNK